MGKSAENCCERKRTLRDATALKEAGFIGRALMIAIRRPDRDQARALIARERQDILRIAELERLTLHIVMFTMSGTKFTKLAFCSRPTPSVRPLGSTGSVY
jgi:hypothetical protein